MPSQGRAVVANYGSMYDIPCLILSKSNPPRGRNSLTSVPLRNSGTLVNTSRTAIGLPSAPKPMVLQTTSSVEANTLFVVT